MSSMRAVSVVNCSFSRVFLAACLAATTASAQNVIPVFSVVDARLSTDGTSVAAPNVFGSAPLNLSCPATGITGVLSGPLPTPSSAPTDLLVDNYVGITVNGATTNLCGPPGQGAGGNPASCFRKAYSETAAPGLDPDMPGGPGTPVGVSGGVAPIDVSSFLAAGPNQVTFDLVDFGGLLTSSSMNLFTNCSPTGVSGNGKVTGSPIPSTNPTPGDLTQPFTFSGTDDLVVQLVFDLDPAFNAGTLDIPNGSTPTVTDKALDPAKFPSFVKGTSFATSQCLIHNGELLNGSPACKIYTLTCAIGQGAESTGGQCPKSSERNVVIQDVFDFPALSLPDIVYTEGNFSETFHQGFGFLEPSDDWFSNGGGVCTFGPNSGVIFSCPQNLLTQFSGPGKGKSTGTSQPVVQSSFISVGPVPEYRTHVDLSPYSANRMWVNTHDPMATFNTRSPILPASFNGGNLNGYQAAPPYSITYGVAPLAGYPELPSTEFPVPGDETILYPGGCPAPGTPAPVIWTPASVQVHVDTDGMYLLHYFATDCAGTEELYFSQDNTGSWSTRFYTAVMFVDTVKPKVDAAQLSPDAKVIGGVLAYHKNAEVKAVYQCSDDFSGVATCGKKSYASPVKSPGVVKTEIDTSKTGTFTVTLPVEDAAQNSGASVKLRYTVVP